MQTCEMCLITWFIAAITSAQSSVKPTATLTLNNHLQTIYIGDRVVLVCHIKGNFSSWLYRWYKGSLYDWGIQIENVTGDTYFIPTLTQSDSGHYRCYSHRNFQPSSSEISNGVILSVQGRRARLEITSGNTDGLVSEGDQVQLLCWVEGDLVEWRYELHKSKAINPYLTQMEPTFIISSVVHSDSGEYRCRARKEEIYSNFSDPVQLYISAPRLTVALVSVGIGLFLLFVVLLLCVYLRIEGLLCILCRSSKNKTKRKGYISTSKRKLSDRNQSNFQTKSLNMADETDKNVDIIYTELNNLCLKENRGTRFTSNTLTTIYSEVRVL
ncbi:low affinity immunoglobulin gamma Fc region receptor II-a-like isoform X2 [Polypterus senegalus]|uniref:low affinity immunoglobulin gamma Fc region receptor II-a-like isoform X2 n=1 Tax=Polypterus senegalus TaxID=55291 RepID=UPI001963123D|nr:low affinity immunoglobulin gamma Fc region receptor II-a-like isoform X2 [Polypterus senegalus]